MAVSKPASAAPFSCFTGVDPSLFFDTVVSSSSSVCQARDREDLSCIENGEWKRHQSSGA